MNGAPIDYEPSVEACNNLTTAASMVVAVAAAATVARAVLALFLERRSIHLPRFRFFGTSLRRALTQCSS